MNINREEEDRSYKAVPNKDIIPEINSKIQKSDREKHIFFIFTLFFTVFSLSFNAELIESYPYYLEIGTFKLSSMEYRSLRSALSYTGILSPFIVLIFLRKNSSMLRQIFIMTIFISICGLLIHLAGAFEEKYFLHMIGHIIYAIGAENTLLLVYLLALKQKIRRHHHLSLIFGFFITFKTMGDYTDSLLTSYLFGLIQNFGFTTLFGIVLHLITLFCAFFLLNKEELEINNNENEISNIHNLTDPRTVIKKSSRNKMLKKFCLLYNICAIWALFYTNLSYLDDLIINYYNFEQQEATIYSKFIFNVCLLVFSPLSGILVDKFKGKGFFLLYSLFGILFGNIMLFNFTQDFKHSYLILPLVMLGVSYSLWWTSIWICFSLTFKSWNEGVSNVAFYISGKNLLCFISFIFYCSDDEFQGIDHTWGFFLFLIITSIISTGIITYFDIIRKSKKFKFLF